jgi:hypothetical protein
MVSSAELQRLSAACDRPDAGVAEAKAYVQELARETGRSPEVVERMGQLIERSAVEHKANIRRAMTIYGISEASALVPRGIRNA